MKTVIVLLNAINDILLILKNTYGNRLFRLERNIYRSNDPVVETHKTYRLD